MQPEMITGNPELEFKDIGNELWREYEFPDGSVTRIDHPQALYVSESGGHRIAAKDGIAHYIPAGWIHLRWTVDSSDYLFSF